MDDRVALGPGTNLSIDTNRTVTITQCIGRGATCLVYAGQYRDQSGLSHRVRLKECYPYYGRVQRCDQGTLVFDGNRDDCLAEFRRACARNVKIRNTLGLMNSATDVHDLFPGNNTLYSLLAYDEGETYQAYRDASLQEVVRHVKALTLVISQYHRHGYLHLDIKPENLLVIPETAEHVLLFDVDSIITEDEIKRNASLRLSYSDGFSAPELVRRNREQLSPAADIFSLGAVLFYKIFGRTPEFADCRLGAAYDFTQMLYRDARFQPAVYRLLRDIFSHTLTLSTVPRWQDTQPLLAVLDRLLPVTDVESVFLCQNFSYTSGQFMGRADELQRMEQYVREKHVLFLSGIGGIGKTELAKQYAHGHQEDYDHILFVPFNGSLRQTICGGEILINTVSRQDGEGDDAYFTRKEALLRSLLTPRDLLILDNFDVEDDADLAAILESWPCQIIITTRCDYSDYNYPQLTLQAMADEADILQVFCAYNDTPYAADEWNAVRQLIRLVEGHTMTVEMYAKYLRLTQARPSQVYRQLLAHAGVTNVDERIHVRQRKDRTLRAKNIVQHLQYLFDVTGFTAAEAELLRSLSLFGYVRMTRDVALLYCPVPHGDQCLTALIQHGWIQVEAASQKISLHSVILDLVYTQLAPTAENCPHAVAALTELCHKQVESQALQDVRDQLMRGLMARLTGTSVAYARLCLAYGQEPYVSRVETLCLARDGRGCADLLAAFYVHRLTYDPAVETHGDWLLADDNKLLTQYLPPVVAQACRDAAQAYQWGQVYSTDAAYLGSLCLQVGSALDEYLERLRMDVMIVERQPLFDRLVTESRRYLAYSETYFLASTLAPAEKIAKLKILRNFYLATNYGSYHSEWHADLDKAARYQELIDGLRDPETQPQTIYVDDMKAGDIALEAMLVDDTAKALQYYLRSLREGEIEAAVPAARLYVKLGQAGAAISLLQDQLAAVTDGPYPAAACYELIRLLAAANRQDEAQQYARDLVQYGRTSAGAYPFNETWLLCGLYWRYVLTTDDAAKRRRWQDCVRQYAVVQKVGERNTAMIDFLVAQAEKLPHDTEKIAALQAIRQQYADSYWHEVHVPCIKAILAICEANEALTYCQVLTLADYSQGVAAHEMARDAQTRAITLAETALHLYRERGLRNAYGASKIYAALSECRNDEDGRHCNYYLLASTDEKHLSGRDKIQLWQQTASRYRRLALGTSLTETQKRTYAELEKRCILKESQYLKDYGALENRDGQWENYWAAQQDLAACYGNLHDRTALIAQVRQMYGLLYTYYQAMPETENALAGYCEKLQYLGWQVGLAGLSRLAVLLQLQALTTCLQRTMDGQQLPWDGEDDVCAACVAALHAPVTTPQINAVVAAYPHLAQHLDEPAFASVAEAFQWFMQTYGQTEIEFKRKP